MPALENAPRTAVHGSDRPLYRYQTRSFGGSFPSVVLHLSSARIVAARAAHGVHPRKSLTHGWPEPLPPKLLRHYVRGYFDGDGSFYKLDADGPNPRAYRMPFVGSEAFLSGCRTFLIDSCGISARPKVRENRRGRPIRVLSYGGRLQVQSFARWLYADATVYLPESTRRSPTCSNDPLRHRARCAIAKGVA